jgi:hypothetical protein
MRTIMIIFQEKVVVFQYHLYFLLLLETVQEEVKEELNDVKGLLSPT